jgi:hypothetical protein
MRVPRPADRGVHRHPLSFHPSPVNGRERETYSIGEDNMIGEMNEKDRYTEMCRAFAEDMDRYASGEMYLDENGEPVYTGGMEPFDVPEEWTRATLGDYLSDPLGIEYIADGFLRFKDVRVQLTMGGPAVFADSRCEGVVAEDIGATAMFPLSPAAVEALREWGREIYEQIC